MYFTLPMCKCKQFGLTLNMSVCPSPRSSGQPGGHTIPYLHDMSHRVKSEWCEPVPSPPSPPTVTVRWGGVGFELIAQAT